MKPPQDRDEPLQRKAICFYFEISTRTLARWERQGLRFIAGRASFNQVLLWRFMNPGHQGKRADLERAAI